MAWASHNSYLGNEEEGREGEIKKGQRKEGHYKRRVREEGSKSFACVCWRGFKNSLCMQIKRPALSVRKCESLKLN